MRPLLPLILFIIAILGTFFYTKPLYTTIQTQLAERATYESALSDAKKLDQVIASLNATKNAFQTTDLDRLDKMIPQNTDNVRLIIEINQIAKKYSSGILAIHVGTQSNTTPSTSQTSINASSGLTFAATSTTQAVPIGFSINTTYAQFLSFIADLQSNLRLVDVTSLGFSPADTGSLYTFNMTVKAYSLK